MEANRVINWPSMF